MGFLGSGDTILSSNVATPFCTRPRATIEDLFDRARLTRTHRVRSRAIRGKMRSFNRSGTNRTLQSERATEFGILQSVPTVGLEPTPSCEDRGSAIGVDRQKGRGSGDWCRERPLLSVFRLRRTAGIVAEIHRDSVSQDLRHELGPANLCGAWAVCESRRQSGGRPR